MEILSWKGALKIKSDTLYYRAIGLLSNMITGRGENKNENH